MTVSEVGRMAIFFSSGVDPLYEFSIRTGFHGGVSIVVRMCDPSYFGRKPFDMCFLLIKNFFRNKHWEVAIFDPYTLDLPVEPLLNFLPDKVRSGLSVVSEKQRLIYYIVIPSEYSSQKHHSNPTCHP